MALLTAGGALTTAGAEALSSGMNFVTSLGGSVAGGLFSANQARKNRKFQERMYNKQVEDTINFWKMQNEYNLPSAVYQRELQGMKDNNLNPLLMYQNGSATGNLAGQPQLPSAPHGAQGQVSSFNTRLDLANLALLEAEVKNKNADSLLKEKEAEESGSRKTGFDIQNEINGLTKSIQVAIKYRDYDYLNTSIDKMRNEIFNSAQITAQNVLTLMQGREYQIKHYNLSEYQVGQSILQGWKQLEIGEIQANAAVKQAAAAWQQAITAANIGAVTVGEINQRIYQSRKLFPQLYKKALYENYSTAVNMFLDFALKGADLSQKQVDIVKSKVGAIRSAAGNDTGLGTALAPFQMPIAVDQKGIESMYNDLLGK